MSRFVLVALGLAALGSVPTSSAYGATSCSHPAAAYDTGGAPGAGTTNDPLFPRQWGLAQIRAQQAWARGATGAGATIAIVDTGVDLDHPDLKPNLVRGEDLTEDGGACPGPQDENGHGTFVAGIAAATAGNGIGVAGTAPSAKIVPIRVLAGETTTQTQVIVLGIRHAADLGARVINVSLGEPPIVGQSQSRNQAFEDAVDYAFDRGSVVVGAAGNGTFPLCSYPSAARRAVCVAATDSRGAPAAYSNFPADPSQTVALRAPGGEGNPILCDYEGDVWSTAEPETSFDCGGGIRGYDTAAGTSMAAPFVSGVAAMLAGRGLGPGQILDCLESTSSNRGAYDPLMGYGIVDADRATASCSAASTPALDLPPGGTGSAPQRTHPTTRPAHVTVRFRRTTKQRLLRSGRLVLHVTSDGPTTVNLRALARGARQSVPLSRLRVVMRGAGTRNVFLRLDRRARRKLRSAGSAARIEVLYRAGSETGSAIPTRR